MKKIPESEIKVSSLSVVDDIGFVFYWKKRIFRKINSSKKSEVLNFLNNKELMRELNSKNLIVKTELSEYTLNGDLLLEHECISPIVYPLEMTFDMIKDCALLIIELTEVLNRHGYALKDCHLFNIAFLKSRPVFIDFGSLLKCKNKDKKTDFPLEEFTARYSIPLKLWKSGCNKMAGTLLCNTTDNLELVVDYYRLKHQILRFVPITLLRRLFRIIFIYKNTDIANSKKIAVLPAFVQNVILTMNKYKLFFFNSTNLKRKKRKILSYNKKYSVSFWGNYHDKHQGQRDLSSTPRFDFIINDILKKYDINSLVDIASNQGVFSILALKAKAVKEIVCIDYDSEAINKLYLMNKGLNLPITCIWQNPFLARSCSEKTDILNERCKSDLALALALTHHLLLSQNFNIDFIFDTIKSYSKKFVLIEFMPLGLWNGTSAPELPEWYTIDWFREHFNNHFKLIQEKQVEDNRIVFLGEIK